MLNIGEKFGSYKITSAIGSGGMGEIYQARDTRLKRDVAIKVLPKKLTKDTSAVERFMREAYSASALNHPNILTIFDIGKIDDINYIATELVEGNTLRSYIKNDSLNLTKAIDIGMQVASALVSAHEANIVHRDIKPENIMVRRDGYVKVLDFGLAKLQEKERQRRGETDDTISQRLTTPGMILGTANYMSPEQARGLEVDTRSDIFSLGIVIYEMIAGVLPFEGETVSDVIAAVLTNEPKPLNEFGNHIPQGFWDCLSKVLAKKRENRFQTIKELYDDLRIHKQKIEFHTELKRVKDTGELPDISNVLETLRTDSENETAIFAESEIRSTKLFFNKQEIDRIDSLAVLPLVNGSDDANVEYLSDGITESIINCLSTVPNLRVIPRSTVFRYKGCEEDAQKIGEELDVCAVLSGKILQIDKTLIVNAELINIPNQSQIWGEHYRHEMTDIFTLQEEIACDISDTLRLKVSGEHTEQLVQNYTENTQAYHYYLKGRYFVTSKRTEKWIKRGIELFQKAIELDPNYALAYSGMAEAYGFLASSTGGWLPVEAYPKAKAAALKALEIDEGLGEAYCSLGFTSLLYEYDFLAAEEHFKKAIELSPTYSNAHDGLGFCLKAFGRHEEAIERCKKVLELDPLSPFSHISVGYGYYFARRFDEAISEYEKALELDKQTIFAYRNLGLAYLQKKEYPKAIELMEKTLEMSDDNITHKTYLGYAYSLANLEDDANDVLNRLRQIAKTQYVPSYNFAMLHLGLGNMDKTFEYLNKAFEERSGILLFMNVEPMLDSLRGDSRFGELIKKIGLS